MPILEPDGGGYYTTIEYVDCYGEYQTINLYAGQIYDFCAKPGTVIYGLGEGELTDNGDCSVTYYYTRTQTFTRNNCGNSYYGSVYSFSKTYSSNISQADAQNIANSDSTFVTEGQAAANSTGSCTLINLLVTNFISPNEDGINDSLKIFQDYNNGSSTTISSGGKTWYEINYNNYPNADVKIFTETGTIIFQRTGLSTWNALKGYWKVGDCVDGYYGGFLGLGSWNCTETIQSGNPWIGQPYYWGAWSYSETANIQVAYDIRLNDGTGRKLQGWILIATPAATTDALRRMRGPAKIA